MEDNRENEQITEETAEEVIGGSTERRKTTRYIWRCYSCQANGILTALDAIPPCPKCGSNDVLRVKES